VATLAEAEKNRETELRKEAERSVAELKKQEEEMRKEAEWSVAKSKKREEEMCKEVEKLREQLKMAGVKE